MISNENGQSNSNGNDADSQKQFVITARQSCSIISSTIIGVGVLTLPRSTVEYAGQAGWMATILGALIAMVAVVIITKLAKRFPGESIVTFSSELLGIKKIPHLGRVLSFSILIFVIVYWGFYTVVVARVFGEVVITTVLIKTPLEIIILTMLGTGLLLVLYDIEVMAKVNEVLLPIIIFPVLIMALSSYQSAKLVNLFPLFDVKWSSFFHGVLLTSFSFLGFEIITLFLAYTQSSKHLTSMNVIGVAIPGVIYTLIVIAGISVFGKDELALLAWPTLELVKTTEVPGLILERLESAFLGVWVAAVFTTVGNFYYATALMIKQVFRLKGHRLIACALLPVFYWLSLKPPNIHVLFKYQSILGYIGGVLAFILPACLLLLAILRKKGKSSKDTAINEEEGVSSA